MRRTVRCTGCGLNQYETHNLLCRRCRVTLPVAILAMHRMPLRGRRVLEEIGHVIATYRMALGLPQKCLGLPTRSTVARVEAGDFYPSLAALEKIAEGFGIPIAWLLEEISADRVASLFSEFILREVRERGLDKQEIVNLIGGIALERTLKKAG